MAGNAKVQSVVRAMEILDQVGRSEQGLTLTELARMMSLNATTVHNLARTLAEGGYLHRLRRGGRYELGPRLDELAGSRRQRTFLVWGREMLCTLAGAVPEATLTVSERLGREIMARLRVSPERSDVVQQPTYQVMAPYTSASSLAFQAWWPAELREAYRRDYPFEEFATTLWNTREKLDEFLAESRMLGIVMLESSQGGLRLAVPVFSEREEFLGVVGLALPVEDSPQTATQRNQLVDTLRAAAESYGALRDDPNEEMLQC